MRRQARARSRRMSPRPCYGDHLQERDDDVSTRVPRGRDRGRVDCRCVSSPLVPVRGSTPRGRPPSSSTPPASAPTATPGSNVAGPIAAPGSWLALSGASISFPAHSTNQPIVTDKAGEAVCGCRIALRGTPATSRGKASEFLSPRWPVSVDLANRRRSCRCDTGADIDAAHSNGEASP